MSTFNMTDLTRLRAALAQIADTAGPYTMVADRIFDDLTNELAIPVVLKKVVAQGLTLDVIRTTGILGIEETLAKYQSE